MTTLTLHHCHEARSMRSLWLLHELNLPFDLVVHPFGPALRSPDYLAVHPLGRVPALVVGDRVLFETGAICEYLCEEYDGGPLYRAPGSPERADWLQWLHYAETIAVHCAALTQQHVVIREDADRSPLIMKLETRRLEKTLGVLEDALHAQHYLLPSGFSAVDIAVGYSIYVARFFASLDSFPNVNAYFQRLSQRAAYQRSLPGADDTRIYGQPFYPVPSQG